MKYGNFVGVNNLKFSDSEIDSIAMHLRKQLESALGEGRIGETVIETDGPYEYCTITFPLLIPVSGRNDFKETVKGVSKIYFMLNKRSGYLEVMKPVCEIEGITHSPMVPTGERDYENAPEFSYGCNMSVNGKCRPYRCRHWESIQNWHPYVYGSEISDLTYSDRDLFRLKATITTR